MCTKPSYLGGPSPKPSVLEPWTHGKGGRLAKLRIELRIERLYQELPAIWHLLSMGRLYTASSLH